MVHLKEEIKDGKSYVKASSGEEFAISEDIRGTNKKFWLTTEQNGETQYLCLVKFPGVRNYDRATTLTGQVYSELACVKILKSLGLNSVDSKLCVVEKANGKIYTGMMSANYREHVTEEISGISISNMYENYVQDNNYGAQVSIQYNTVDEYINMLKYLKKSDYKSSKGVFNLTDQEIDQLRNELLALALFDYVTIQTDRHWGNVSLIFNPKHTPRCHLAPIYDNENAFILKKSMSKLDKYSQDLLKTQNPQDELIRSISGTNGCPMLGIKTSLVEKIGPTTIVAKKDDKNFCAETILTTELATEILKNDYLSNLYQEIRTLSVGELLSNEPDFPANLIVIVENAWKIRLEELDEEIKRQMGQMENENESSAKL